MDSQFKYNKFFLFFLDTSTNKAYQKARTSHDLQALSYVLAIGAIISILFLFLDIYRFQETAIYIVFRGFFALSLIAFLIFIKFLPKKNYQAVQSYIFFIASYAFCVGFAQAVFMEKAPAFLSNFLASIIFVGSTIFGLRFRYILILNTSAFFGYLFFVQLQDFPSHSIAVTQIPQLGTFYIIGVISAYVLELNKMKLFKNQYLLKIQFNKVDGLNQIKDRLFRTISHDIRGPIMNLKGVTSLYKKGNISNEEMIGLVSSLDSEVAKTSNLIDNLLAWSKSQLEGLEITKTVYNIYPQVQEAIAIYEALIKEKNINVLVEMGGIDTVFADKETLFIVIRNLLSNAIKFTPIGGSILIGGKEKSPEKCYEITIKDSGTGIDKTKIKALFKLSHEKVIGDQQSTGAGLGLTLVKEFVDLNGGKIYCDSQVGVGTTFKVEIPQPQVD